MLDIIEEISQNAGKVWTILNVHGPLSPTIMVKTTSLDEKQLYAAIGWLARENKICKNGNIYELRETNLTGKIGSDAGKLWRIFETWGDVDVGSMTRLAQIDEQDVYFALGWLARENKIETDMSISKGNLMRFRLK